MSDLDQLEVFVQKELAPILGRVPSSVLVAGTILHLIHQFRPEADEDEVSSLLESAIAGLTTCLAKSPSKMVH